MEALAYLYTPAMLPATLDSLSKACIEDAQHHPEQTGPRLVLA